MAIKRLRLNDEGEFEERKLEQSELPPPPPKPGKAPRKSRSSSSRAAGPVKTTRIKGSTATKKAPAGRTVLDEGVIRYECATCGSARVLKEVAAKAPNCGMCQRPMRLENK